MTAYNAIADSDIDPESPGTTTLFTRLRDNPIAITEGSSGAPNIQTAGIANNAVTTAKLATGEQMTTTNVLAAIAAGSVGAVGTYAWMIHRISAADTSPGGTVAGSSLRYAGLQSGEAEGDAVLFSGLSSTPAGTWMCMGYSNYGASSTTYPSTLWLRIS